MKNRAQRRKRFVAKGWEETAAGQQYRDYKDEKVLLHKCTKAWLKIYDEFAEDKTGRQEFLSFKKEYDATLRNLEEKLADLKRQKRAMDTEEGYELEAPDAVLETTELTQEILDTFVEYVEGFEDDRLDIHWRFDPEI